MRFLVPYTVGIWSILDWLRENDIVYEHYENNYDDTLIVINNTGNAMLFALRWCGISGIYQLEPKTEFS